MAYEGEETDSNRACAEFVRAAISSMPSVLERLVYLASLKDLNTGEYQDHVLEALLALKFGHTNGDPARRGAQVLGLRCGKAELDRALRREHLAAFEDWLCLDLRHQVAQVESYAARQGVPSHALSGEWMHKKSYERLTPSGAMPFQRRLFLADLERVLSILSRRQAT